MGKPAYLHRNKWQDKQLLELVKHCRQLEGHIKGRTLEQLTIYHFGMDGHVNKERMRAFLKDVFYYLLQNEGIVFGPVTLGGWGCPHFWCVATQPWEKKQILGRFLRNADGNLRRIFGSHVLQQNWLNALGEPLRPLIEQHEQIREAGQLLLPRRVICLHCQTEVYQANFCGECGGKLNSGS